MKRKLNVCLAMAIAAMGVVHIIATFTPLIQGGLETLGIAKQNAMTYMSLMCGMLLVVCGLLAVTLGGKLKKGAFLLTPYRIIVTAMIADGIAAVAFMPHNPFAWIVFALVCGFAISLFYDRND